MSTQLERQRASELHNQKHSERVNYTTGGTASGPITQPGHKRAVNNELTFEAAVYRHRRVAAHWPKHRNTARVMVKGTASRPSRVTCSNPGVRGPGIETTQPASCSIFLQLPSHGELVRSKQFSPVAQKHSKRTTGKRGTVRQVYCKINKRQVQ